MISDYIKSLAAQIDEFVELFRRSIPAVDDVSHVGRQNEGGTISLEVAEHLGVAEEFSEIYVE